MHFTIDTDLALIGIAIGVAAIIMAVPPFVQMIFGRPHLEIEFHDFTGSEGKQLIISMRNKTVRRWLSARLGVERETGEVMAHFNIRDAGTQAFVVSDVSAYLHSAATREFGLVLRAMAGHTVGFPVLEFANGSATIMDARRIMDRRPLAALSPGDYLAEAFVFRGQTIYPVSRRFKVGPTAHETVWR